MHPRIRVLCRILLLAGIPALVFLPGIGAETSHPALMAREAPPVTWPYRVRSGDVLTVIAERELGTFRRYDEILALNPQIEPRALEVGSVLRMPPRQPPPPAPATAPPGPRRLLPLFLAMLGLMALVFAVTRYLERRRAWRRA